MVHKLRPALIALLILVAALFAIRPWGGSEPTRTAAACHRESDREGEAAREEGEHAREEREAGSATNPMYAGPRIAESPCGDRPGHPESFLDLAQANGQRTARAVAPGTQLKAGAYRAAVSQRADLPSTGGTWSPYGKTPLIGDRSEYDTTNGSTSEGLSDLSGRVTSFAADASGDHVFAAASNGGIWMSTDRGDSWSSIGDTLPTQVVSGIAWSPADGGTLIVLTGDNAFGGDSIAGLGVYRSSDLGAHWTHAAGVPDGLLGFKVAVDPTQPNVVYAATGGGLFRSTDAGASFTNVNLPTGEGRADGTPDCTGQPITAKDCFLANVVTDVVVQGPANANTSGANAKPGAVLAAVGWRAGQKTNADGSQESPNNGIYESDSGEPGTFKNLDFAGNSTPIPPDVLTQARIGRIALGIAQGPDQDHRVVYALVQDAVKFNGGLVGLDANENGTTSAAQSDYLNGLWASTDFGHMWQMIEGSSVIDNDPTSNSALAPPTCKTPALISYCPGIQAWYNLWLQPDPTQSTASGIPTRLAFGLEELWHMTDAAGIASAPEKASVVGRYYANASCTLLNATNGLPICPVAEGGATPKTTTHPDQHGYLWLPDASGGGVTLFAGNDGGIYKQHLAPGDSLSNDKWGRGANAGLNTLQPYDAVMAKDGTVYMGLQDNGEGKIDPDGTAYTIFGGDGFFTAVDPDNADHAYEEYVAGDINATKDGGKTWTDIAPSNMTDGLFSTPFEMDPNDANHLMIGGRQVEETTQGVDTTSDSWKTVFDLGTQKHPGDASAQAAADDPVNQLSAVDVNSIKVPGNAPTGPHTADFASKGGENTLPGGQDLSTGLPIDPLAGTFPPGTYEDTPFTIGPNDGDASVLITVKGATDSDDWDLYVYHDDGSGNLTEVGSSASSASTESVNIPNPAAGKYVVRVVNFNAAGQYSLTGTFTQRTDSSDALNAAYVGFCGYCDTITQGTPFGRGLATNVGGDKPGKAGTSDGWHIAKADGLPERIITSVRMDPTNPSTVYVTLGGYGRKWAYPGAVGEDTSKVGSGHVFKSTDAGATFTDVTGNLPDAPANWSVLHNGHLVVGTDVGVFESCDNAGGAYSVLGGGLPAAPISTLRFKPGDPDLLVAATYGRGVYTYRFGADEGRCAIAAGAQKPGAAPCAKAAGFKRAKVTPRGHGLRFTISRRINRPFSVDVFRDSRGRRVLNNHRVLHLTGRTKSLTWKGAGRRVGDGYYFARLVLAGGGQRDTRRFTLVRSHGRFHLRPPHYAKDSCTLIRSAKLSSPAWGGTRHTSLGTAIRLTRSGSVTITIRRGKKLIKRFSIKHAGAKTRRVGLKAGHLPRGDYRVTIAATAASLRQSVVLTSRKL
jgi:hypothetical protein